MRALHRRGTLRVPNTGAKYRAPTFEAIGFATFYEMIKLLSLEEMKRRHQEGEDPFALAIEKWIRIRDFLHEKSSPARYREAFHCASSKVLFCVDYSGHCPHCPLESICFDSQSLHHQIMRHLQVYSLAGTLLPRGPILEMIESYICNLRGYRRDWMKRSN